MKIATWNVNSIKARLPNVLDWLGTARPDVALLQEIKTVDEGFPALEIGDLGYNIATHGQKSYNGVAILSKFPIEDVLRGLPPHLGFPEEIDEQSRYIEATIAGFRIASLYCPNGNPAGDGRGASFSPSDKFRYKIRWFERLHRHVQGLLANEEVFVLGGDYNICPKDEDVYDPIGWADDALVRPEARAAFRRVMNLGLTDALRAIRPTGHDYTFWDYQRGAWQNNHGLRIDHFLLSPQAADRLETCQIDSEPRNRDKASDHVPVWVQLRDLG